MADQILDSVDSAPPSGRSPFTLLNKLPTKRIDAAIASAAESGLPEQGEQTGGYTLSYAHLSHLPLFSLYSEAQQDLLVKKQAFKERMVKQMDANDPDKLLSGSQRLMMNIFGHLSGTGGVISMKRWERRLIGANVVTSNMVTEQSKLVVFTRWTVPNTHETLWFVDVLEQRFLDPNRKLSKVSGNAVMLKVAPSGAKKDSKVTLKLPETDAKCLKPQKMWTKWRNFAPCDAITFIGEGEEVPMEIVARIQRTCSILEAQELQRRFEKEWNVPVLQ
jgi:hypothetical protein